MQKLISIQNPFIKSLVVLREKSRARQEKGVFLIEGQQEIQLAIKGGYDIEKVLFNSALCSESDAQELAKNADLIEISKQIFQKLAYRENTGGVIAIAKIKSCSLDSLDFGENPLILVVESPEKPGNIGALLRTADAAKMDAVIIANPKSDLYNPNVVRSSVGCLFTNQIAIAKTEDVISFLKKYNIAIYCATLQDSTYYDTLDYTDATAFVLGNESTGLSQKWRAVSTKNITIPMNGKVDSMNVSVSAGVLIFEAKRQRGF